MVSIECVERCNRAAMAFNAAGFAVLAIMPGSLLPLVMFVPSFSLSGFAAVVSWRGKRAAERRLEELDRLVEELGDG